jgi:hypothetical protein
MGSGRVVISVKQFASPGQMQMAPFGQRPSEITSINLIIKFSPIIVALCPGDKENSWSKATSLAKGSLWFLIIPHIEYV